MTAAPSSAAPSSAVADSPADRPDLPRCAGLSGRILRFVLGARAFPDVPFFVPDAPPFAPEEGLVEWSGDRFSLRTEDIVVTGAAAHEPFRIHFEVGDAKVYGFGAATGAPTRNDARFRIMTLDTLFYGIEGASYTAMPFFLVQHGTRLLGVLIATSFPLDVEVDAGRVSFRAAVDTEQTPLDVLVLQGNAREILLDLARLVGSAALPPAWAFGFHQSRWSYKTQEAVLDVARGLREHELPADVVHLDIHTMDDYRVFTFSPERFPDPRGLHTELKTLGIRTMAIVDPGVSATSYSVYDEGTRQDIWLKRRDGSAFEGKVWPGATVFPDFAEPRVRELWGKFHQPLVDAGVAGVWNDMNDPVFRVGKIYDPLVEDVRHASGSHRKLRNLYANHMAEATQQGFRALRPDVRPFVLTRSGFLGIQRFAAVWTGDNFSAWDQLEENLHMVVNLGLSGVPICGADVGGFGGRRGLMGIAKLRPPAELFVRWMELGSLMPFFRVHSVLYSPHQEPWRFGKKALALSRKLLRRRYRLLPLFYRLALEAHETGLPLVRPMWMHAEVPAGPPSVLASEQFFLGEDLLAAPVLHKGVTRRDVWLPQGTWIDFESGEILAAPEAAGRVVSRHAPLGSPPLLIRAGSALFGAVVARNVDDTLRRGITLEVSAPAEGRTGSGSLFLDDGESRDAPRFMLDATVTDLGGRLAIAFSKGASSGSSGVYPFHTALELRVPRPFTRALVDGNAVPLAPLDLGAEDRHVVMNAGRVPMDAREIVLE